MARYPTFEEYRESGKYKDGIKRCNDLLKKNPNDVQLLTVKLQLLFATESDGSQVLDHLLSIQPHVQDLREIVEIEDAIVSSQKNEFPQLKTTGPIAAKLWDNASKASNNVNYKLDLQSLRLSRAIVNNRLADAQQALIQLKALQPKNRTIYMAHAAITQMLSTSKDDLQARLSLSLARKAVAERFDDDKSLDCRVPGQIFALQGSFKDLDAIAERSFKESKQVHDALQEQKNLAVNGTAPVQSSKDPQSVPQAEWLLLEVDGLKQQFAKLIDTPATSEIVVGFAANSVRLFHTATKTLKEDRRRVKADACFLSISALVRLWEHSGELHYLLQAALLAEILLERDTHIHEARVILVYLYMRLGLGSLALRLFHSLNVKEIQFDTIGHALFTRISLTHPSKTTVSRKTSVDPHERATHALGVYIRCEEKLAENEASVLSHGQTGMIFDLQELRDHLRSSVTKRITYLEQRRMRRLVPRSEETKEERGHLGPRTTANWLTTTDNRDLTATFDYGYNVEKVLHGDNGVLPGRNWIICALALDTAWCLAMEYTTLINDIDRLVEELKNIALDIDRLRLDDHRDFLLGMRDVEYLTGDLACQVLKMLVNLTTRPAELSDDLEEIRKSVNRLSVEALVDAPDAFTERLVDHFDSFDALRIVVKACKFVRLKTSQYADTVEEIADLATAQCKTLQRRAQEQIKQMNVASIKALLAQDDTTWEEIKLFGEDHADSFCQTVVESAKEGWKGSGEIQIE